jgi:hypothetical protein
MVLAISLVSSAWRIGMAEAEVFQHKSLSRFTVPDECARW